MVDTLSAFFSQNNNQSIFGLFQAISSTAGIGNNSIIQKSGATVFAYQGASFNDKISILNYNDKVRRSNIEKGLTPGFSSASPSLLSTDTTTQNLIKDLQQQIKDLRKQLGLPEDTTTPSFFDNADALIKNRYSNTGHSYSISTVSGKDIAQETPKNIKADPNVSNELVFRITRSGDLSKSSSVAYDFVEHLSTATRDDFSTYKNNDYQFTNPTRNILYPTGVSGLLDFSAGESSKNVTVTIPNDGVLETRDEHLTIGVYNNLSNQLLAHATGLIKSDKDNDIIMISPQLGYKDSLGEYKTFSDLDKHLALADLSEVSLKSFVRGQLSQDEKLKVEFEIAYTTIDTSSGTPSIATMTLSDTLFLSADPDVVAGSIDPINGKITSSAKDRLSQDATLKAAIAALGTSEQLKIDIMVTSADYVDDKGSSPSAVHTSLYTSPLASGIDDTLTLLIGDVPTYEIVTPPVQNVKEGGVYEIVVMRDQSFSKGSVEVMLADVASSGFDPLADISFATGTTPTDTYTLDFAVGQSLATLSLTIEDDTAPEPVETFSATLSVPTGGTAALGSSSSINVMIDVDPSDTAPPSTYEITPVATTKTGYFDVNNRVDVAELNSIFFNIMRSDDINAEKITLKLEEVDLGGIHRTRFDNNDLQVRIGGTTSTLNMVGTGYETTVDFAIGIDNIEIELYARGGGVIKETYEGFKVSLEATGTSTVTSTGTKEFNGRIIASAPSTGDPVYSFSASTPATVNEGDQVEVVVERNYDETTGTINISLVGMAGPMGSGITAAAASDLSTSFVSLTFAPGELEKTFTFNIIDDTLEEGKERIGLYSAISMGGGTTAPTKFIDINTSDMFTLMSPASVNEGGTALIEITRSDTSIVGQTIMFDIDAGMTTNTFSLSGAASTALSMSSFTGQTLTFSGTDATATITITVDDDNRDEGSDTISFSSMIGTSSYLSFISLDDSADAGKAHIDLIEVTGQSKSIYEMETYEFIIERSPSMGMLPGTAYLMIAADGTSFSPDDIVPSVSTSAGSITYDTTTGALDFTFSSSTSTRETITLTPRIDGDTATETFKISVVDMPGSDLYGAEIVEEISGVSILPDTLFSLMSVSSSVSEGDEYVVVVSRSDRNRDTVNIMLSDVAVPTGIDLAMDLATPTASGGTVTDLSSGAGTDYQIQFNSGEDRVSITFSVTDDPNAEVTEQFDISLSLPTGVTGAALGANMDDTVSITDNDSEFSFTIRDSTNMIVTALTEGQSYEIEVMRVGGGAVNLGLSLSDLKTSLTPSEYTIGTPTLVFGAGDITRTTSLIFVMDTVNEMAGNEDEFIISGTVSGTPPGSISYATPTRYSVTDP